MKGYSSQTAASIKFSRKPKELVCNGASQNVQKLLKGDASKLSDMAATAFDAVAAIPFSSVWLIFHYFTIQYFAPGKSAVLLVCSEEKHVTMLACAVAVFDAQPSSQGDRCPPTHGLARPQRSSPRADRQTPSRGRGCRMTPSRPGQRSPAPVLDGAPHRAPGGAVSSLLCDGTACNFKVWPTPRAYRHVKAPRSKKLPGS